MIEAQELSRLTGKGANISCTCPTSARREPARANWPEPVARRPRANDVARAAHLSVVIKLKLDRRLNPFVLNSGAHHNG